MRLLVFAGSLRRDSFNRKLAALAAELARAQGHEVDHADFREFEMPPYDGDLETDAGLPEGALRLKARVEAADAIILSSPEYNNGIPGTLKNAIDWVSRARPMPWAKKPMLLVTASPGPFGGVRSLGQLRLVMMACSAWVYPDSFNLARANVAFADDGRMNDAGSNDRLAKLVEEFGAWAGKLRA